MISLSPQLHQIVNSALHLLARATLQNGAPGGHVQQLADWAQQDFLFAHAQPAAGIHKISRVQLYTALVFFFAGTVCVVTWLPAFIASTTACWQRGISAGDTTACSISALGGSGQSSP